MSRPTKRLRLIRRLNADHGFEIPENTPLERTRAGHVQRTHGAWSWTLATAPGGPDIGSQWSVTELLSDKAWALNGLEINLGWNEGQA